MTEAQLSKQIDELTSSNIPVDQRSGKVNDLIEAYVKASGLVPSDRLIARLTNWILADELKSNNKRWAKRPFYTDEQLNERRRKHEVPLDFATGG